MLLWRMWNISTMCELEGKVKSGLGEGHFWIDKVSKVFKEKYNINLFLGTLNIELDKEYILKGTDKILSNEYGGQYDVLVQRCEILGKVRLYSKT